MDVFLHTIAIEPCRWTAKKVAVPLIERLDAIAAAGFRDLEVFEPHVALAEDAGALFSRMASLGLRPRILSSYIQVSPSRTNDELFAREAGALLEKVRLGGFGAVRIFGGTGVDLRNGAAVEAAMHRIGLVANMLHGEMVLVETHDGGIADDPEVLVDAVKRLGCPNVGLLFQPTVFSAEAALEQWRIQKPLVRHFHLQNRSAPETFATLSEGNVDWATILAEAPEGLAASVEFVPAGIAGENAFDFAAALAQCASERDWALRCRN